MRLRDLTRDECQQVRVWRNDPDVLPMLRTGIKTEAEQDAFYRDIVCNPDSDHRYYALDQAGQFVGMGGLTYLSRVPGEAEISLILGPDFRGKGYGTLAVDALLEEAKALGLSVVTGECYALGNLAFWASQCRRHPGAWEGLPCGTLRWRWEL